MRRPVPAPLALLGLLFVPAFADDRPADPGAGERRQEIEGKLRNFKVDLDFTDTPLADVVDFLRDAARIDILIDPRVEAAHPGDNLKVSLKVHDLPLKTVLKLLLDRHALAWTVRDGVVLILPASELKKDVVLKIYDVRDLLMKIENFPGPTVELASWRQGNMDLSGLRCTLEDPPSVFNEDTVVDLIRRSTARGDWDANPSASITLSNGLLFVTQTSRVHAEVQGLLDGLRAFK